METQHSTGDSRRRVYRERGKGFEPREDGRSLRSRCVFSRSNPPARSHRSRVFAVTCEGRDLNPRTSTGAGLKPTAVGLLGYPRTEGTRPLTVWWDVRFGVPSSYLSRTSFTIPSSDRIAVEVPSLLVPEGEPYQSTLSVPSPSGSGANSASARRSTTWIQPSPFFAGQTRAASMLASRSSSPT